MYGYIYKTTNLINGKIYIGKKTSERFDPNYKGSGKILKQAIKKYGWDSFRVELICECSSPAELNSQERAMIIKYDSRVPQGKGYNISEGGDWGDISRGLTPEQYTSWNQHKSEAQKGQKFTKEHCLHISQAMQGENNHCYGKRGPDSHNYGKKHPNRTFHRICRECGAEFISRSNRALTCDRCKEILKRPKNPSRVFKVVCLECGSEFQSYSNNPRQKCPACRR